MPENKKKFIAVIGGEQCSPQEAKLAEGVGRELARRGVILLCGGLGGVMKAACKAVSCVWAASRSATTAS